MLVLFWYIWLAIQNTTTSQAHSLFRVAGVIISFLPEPHPQARRPTDLCSDQLRSSKKKEKKKKKKKKKEKKTKKGEFFIPKPGGLRTCVRISCARSPFWEIKTFDGGKKREMKKRKKMKIVPKRSGPIFCRGGLRLAGR
jgi:hypothetical protein